MRILTCSVVMVALFGLAMTGCKSPEEKTADKEVVDKELALLKGKWKLTEFTGNATDPELSKEGDPAPKNDTAGETGIVYSFDGDMLEVKYGNNPTYYKLSLEPGKDPKRMDLLLVESTGKAIQKTVYERTGGKKKKVEYKERKRDDKRLGVYKIDGDKLTICFAYGGKDRPDSFSAPAETYRALWTLKKVAGSDKPAEEKPKDVKEKKDDEEKPKS